MKDIFGKIWELALPYQDKRNDFGHAEITTQFAVRLLETEKGDEKVVLPAIIMHDIGWSQVSEKERMSIFDSKITPEEESRVRKKHEEEGVKLARQILEKIHYPTEFVEEILDIISEHDTRKGFASANDGLVRDADKLWRFSKTGFEADMKRFGFSFEELYKRAIKQIELPNFLYSKSAKRIAYEELEMRKIDCSESEK